MEQVIQFTKSTVGNTTTILYQGESVGKITGGGRVWIEGNRERIPEAQIEEINKVAFRIRQNHIRWWRTKTPRQQYEMLLDRLPCSVWLPFMRNSLSLNKKVDTLFHTYIEYYA